MTSSSYASITDLTVMENPRQTTTKGFAFDANFFVGSSTCPSLLALLRFFNANNITFPTSPTLYYIYATVAKMDASAGIDLFNSDLKATDYALVGDIQFIIPLGVPGDLDIDTRQRPYVHLAGVALKPDFNATTFTIDSDQYTSSFREAQKVAKDKKEPVCGRSFFPADCIIHDSPRYAIIKKPIPFNRHFVMFTGYIAGISSSLENSEIKERFCIDVENVAFLGTSNLAQASTTKDSPAASSSVSTPVTASGRTHWSYDTPVAGANKRRKTSSPPPTEGGSSSPPRSSSP
ncbi:hypothetical protein FB451DRAFT_1170625 [Mycena latifolia]|nr:hypothetical protein FB451DRAFT_1170625 [Mycena latifolia]